MPRVQFPLGAGWSQDPSEEGGDPSPKVSRLVNCSLDAQGHVSPHLGEASMPRNYSSGYLNGAIHAAGITNGTGVVVTEGTSAADFAAYGFTANSRTGSVWRQYRDASERMSTVEAPIARQLFNDEKAHYYFATMLDLGGGKYLAIAERATENGGPIWPQQFLAELEWALLDGNAGMTVTERGYSYPGNSLLSLPANCHTWLCAAGKYLITYTAANTIKVIEYDASSGVLTAVVRATFTGMTLATAYGPGIRLDASISPDGTRLAVVANGGQLIVWDTSSWAVGYSGTPAYGTAGNSGTYGVAAQNGGTYLVAFSQAASNNWFLARIDGAWVVSSLTNIFAASGLVPSTYLTRGASVVASPGTAHVVVAIPQRQGTTSETTYLIQCSTAGVVVGNSTIVTCSPIATKPVVFSGWSTVDPGIYTWCFQSSGDQGRTVRSAILVGQRNATFGPYRYAAQQTHVFRGGDPAPVPAASHLYGNASNMLTCNYVPPDINGNFKHGYCCVLPTLKEAEDYVSPGHTPENIGTNVWLVMFADAKLSADDEPPADVFDSANYRGACIMALGEPKALYPRPEFTGFDAPPNNPTVTHPAVGSYPAAGTYIYVVVFRRINSQGDVQWSPVSDPITIVNATQGSNLITYSNIDPQLGVDDAAVEVYRTTNNGTVFYRVSEATTAAGSFTDTISDLQLVTRPVLYTQGERSGTSGMLQHFGCPPCRTIFTGLDRMIAGGLANENRVQFSNLFFPGEAVSWPQDAAFFVDMDSAVVGVWQMDSVWVVFTRTGVWAITGQGPDAQGSGLFDIPRRISMYGAQTGRSVVEMTAGLCFQATNGQVYLLQRGSLTLQWLSRPIRFAITASTAVAETTEYHTNYVTGAIYDAETQCAYFAMAVGGIVWIYDETSTAWYMTTGNGNRPNLKGAWSVSMPDIGYTGPVFIGSGAYSERLRRGNDGQLWCGADGVLKLMTVETADLDIGGGRVRRGWVTLRREKSFPASSAIAPVMRVDWFYDGSPRAGSSDWASTITPDSYPTMNEDRLWEIELAPGRQKCNQLRVKITVSPQIEQPWVITGFAVDAETKGKKIRNASGKYRA